MTTEEQATADELAAAKLVEDQKVADAEALKQFTEGFTDVPAEPVVPAEPTADELKAQEEAAAETARLAAEAAAKAAEPVLAKVTETQLLDLVNKANSVADIRTLVEKVRDTTNGRVGSLEQTIKNLQASTPVGQAIVVTPEDFAEIGKDLPEHAKMLADGLTRVLSKFKGTAAPAQAETPEQFEERVNAAADKRIHAREVARRAEEEKEARADIASIHADWETVVGKPDVGSPWRTWLDTQSPLYKKRMLNTMDPLVLAESLTKFKELQAKPTPPVVPSTREQRLREAIPAKGGAIAPNTKREKTALEEFNEGFTS